MLFFLKSQRKKNTASSKFEPAETVAETESRLIARGVGTGVIKATRKYSDTLSLRQLVISQAPGGHGPCWGMESGCDDAWARRPHDRRTGPTN